MADGADVPGGGVDASAGPGVGEGAVGVVAAAGAGVGDGGGADVEAGTALPLISTTIELPLANALMALPGSTAKDTVI